MEIDNSIVSLCKFKILSQMRCFLILLSLLCFHFGMKSQIEIDTNFTIEEYVQQTFGSQMLSISNIEFNNQNANHQSVSIGGFTSQNSAISIPQGMALSTGMATQMVGPNYYSHINSNGDDILYADPDLTSIMNISGDFDPGYGWKLEFDFIPMTDSIVFYYHWCSEEYSRWVGDFNDAFAILLSGPGNSGPYSGNSMNLATLPESDVPISISTINNGSFQTGPCENCEYFHQSIADDLFPAQLLNPIFTDPYYPQYNGYSSLLKARGDLQCGQSYHIKILLGHSDDGGIDSGVFITGDLDDNTGYNPLISATNVEDLFEGCILSEIQLSRPSFSDMDTPFPIELTVSGTALPGIDYEILPSIISIPPGQNSISLPINVVEDGIDESEESILLSFSFLSQCGSASESIELFLHDTINPLSAVGEILSGCHNTSLLLQPQISGGSGIFEYLWSTGESSFSIEPIIDGSSTFVLSIHDLCTDLIQIANFEVIEYDTVTILAIDTLISTCVYQDIELEISGGLPPYYPFFNGDPSYLNSNNNITLYDLLVPYQGNYTVSVLDGCGTLTNHNIYALTYYDSIQIAVPDTFIVNCYDTTFQIVPEVISGSGLNYTWNLNGTEWLDSDSLFSLIESEPTEGFLEIVALNECSYSDTVSTWLEYGSVIAPPIYAVGEYPYCFGDSILLYTDEHEDFIYQWTFDGSIIPDGNYPEYMAFDGGNYTVNVSSSLCSGVGISPVYLAEIAPLPEAAFAYEINGAEVQFDNQSIGASDYYWSFGDGSHTEIPNPIYEYDETGSYTVLLIAYSDYCGNDTTIQIFSVVDIEEKVNEFDWKIFPNPTTQQFTIYSENWSGIPRRLDMIDTSGRVVFSQNMNEGNSMTIKLTNQEIQAGVYLLRLRINDEVYQQRILILSN